MSPARKPLGSPMSAPTSISSLGLGGSATVEHS